MKILISKDEYGIQEIIGAFNKMSNEELNKILANKGLNLNLEYGVNKKEGSEYYMWFEVEVY